MKPMGIDETKVRPKQPVLIKNITSGLVEKSIFILSRVYRNSNICNHGDISQQILNYVLDGTCNLGFMLIDDSTKMAL